MYIVSVLGESQPRPAPIAAGDGPVLAITCLSKCSLLASVAGRITLIDCVLECALRSLEAVLWLDGAAHGYERGTARSGVLDMCEIELGVIMIARMGVELCLIVCMW